MASRTVEICGVDGCRKGVHVPSMTLTLEIPDDAVCSLGNPGRDAASVLKLELALALYQRGALSIGAASQVAGLKRFEFEAALAEREIERNYGAEDRASDVAWAKSAS